jgi:Aspartyl protease
MTTFQRLACFLLVVTMVPVLEAKTRCPGNAASVPLHLLDGQIVVDVLVNHSGAYPFLLDTGTQTTTIDPSLADQLRLITQGTEEIAGVGFQTAASTVMLNVLETGSEAVPNLKVLVFRLQKLQIDGLNIRGVLGEDFLEHFDILIDNAHSLLCLDDSTAMRTNVKGPHIALIIPANTSEGRSLARALVVESRLSDGMRPIRLWLDTGSNVPFLYNPSEYLAIRRSQIVPQTGIGGDGSQAAFMAVPAQDVRLGTLQLTNVRFFTFLDVRKGSNPTGIDGLLTISLFRRVFICHSNQYLVLEPW